MAVDSGSESGWVCPAGRLAQEVARQKAALAPAWVGGR
jgi:hypothetical protein